MRLALLLLAALAAAPSPASAQLEWQVNGQAAPGDRSRASRDGFGVMMMVTPDAQTFWRAWDGPTPPNLVTTDRAIRGQPVTGMVLFSGCGAGPDGNCNLTGEFIVLRPDGTRSGEPLRGSLWRGPPAPGYNVQLAEGSLGLIVEPEDPMGVWTLRAIVTDNVRGVTLQVEQQVTVDTPPSASAPST